MPSSVSSTSRVFELTSLVLLLFLGLAPSLVFFIWIERSASLPWVAIEFGWPWLDLRLNSIGVLCAWNLLLFFGFGALHSWMAQRRFPRRLYMILTGLSTIAVMGLWQNTGLVIYALPLSQKITYAVSLSLFWSLAGASAWVLTRHGATSFVGITPDIGKASGKLQTHGMYSIVRHPAYTLTLLAFILTPVMTLDRFLIVAATWIYLWIAVPFEEKKLVQEFGEAYKAYQRQVPSFVPKIWRRP